MKPSYMFHSAALLWFHLLVPAVSTSAQPANHGFSSIGPGPDSQIQVTFSGKAPAAVRAFFDLYPVESSGDLLTWQASMLLVRTNANTNELQLSLSAPSGALFLRTPTNHFITPLPRPTGPYPVGVVNRLLTDPTRTNRYGIKTNSSFMATIWYPAQVEASLYPAPYVEQSLALKASDYFDETANVASFTAFSRLSALFLARSQGWPVILYSHGYPAHRRQNTGKAEELASHGYVVVAVDHEDCFGTVFPDGRFIPGRFADFSLAEARRTTPGRLADLKWVLDLLRQWNESDSVLAGGLDSASVGAIGYSHGGNGAAELARLDSRCRAVALLDAYLYELPALRTNGVPVPLLQMYSASPSLGFDNVQAVYAKTTTNAYFCQIKGTEHSSFSDLKNNSQANAANRRAEEAIRACLVSFFDRHLKGKDDHLLDNPTNQFPVLTQFKKK